jgi:hypothetical protein
MTKTTTRTVAGFRLALIPGVQYWASRPMANRGRHEFPVTIQPMHGDAMHSGAVTIPGLDYEAANRLVNGFNNGPISFDGRVW